MPSHKHTASTNSVNISGTMPWMLSGKDGGFSGAFSSASQIELKSIPAGDSIGVWKIPFSSNHSHTVTINNTGSGNSHNNISPYVASYIWLRVS